MPSFQTPFGTYKLQRIPAATKLLLQAWDAADELLLNHLHENSIENSDSILITNDAFGALSTALHSFSTINYSDSFIAHQASKMNHQENNVSDSTLYLASTEVIPKPIDIVIIKLPKTLALLEHQLISIRPHIHEHTRVVAAGMVKYIQPSHYQLMEKYIGKTKPSLTKKKARLLFSMVEIPDQYQSPYPTNYKNEKLNLTLWNHANVFSRQKLDIGTRFMLEQFDELPAAETILDVGCGNGLLGIQAKRQIAFIHQIQAKVTMVDESYMALDSAGKNYQQTFSNEEIALSIFPSNCLDNIDEQFDLILCNPPFHQQQHVGDHIAWTMFNQSNKKLNINGELWVVGNRHLNYHSKLKKIFGNVDLINNNRKFVVLRCKKNPSRP